jgi:hypothetical protein
MDVIVEDSRGERASLSNQDDVAHLFISEPDRVVALIELRIMSSDVLTGIAEKTARACSL